MANVEMNNQEKFSFGVDILDKDGQSFSSPPPGTTLEVTNSNESIVDVVVRPDGLNWDVYSDQVGSAKITVKGVGFASPVSDYVIDVSVLNSAPNSLNGRLSAPELEEPELDPSQTDSELVRRGFAQEEVDEARGDASPEMDTLREAIVERALAGFEALGGSDVGLTNMQIAAGFTSDWPARVAANAAAGLPPISLTTKQVEAGEPTETTMLAESARRTAVAVAKAKAVQDRAIAKGIRDGLRTIPGAVGLSAGRQGEGRGVDTAGQVWRGGDTQGRTTGQGVDETGQAHARTLNEAGQAFGRAGEASGGIVTSGGDASGRTVRADGRTVGPDGRVVDRGSEVNWSAEDERAATGSDVVARSATLASRR